MMKGIMVTALVLLLTVSDLVSVPRSCSEDNFCFPPYGQCQAVSPPYVETDVACCKDDNGDGIYNVRMCERQLMRCWVGFTFFDMWSEGYNCSQQTYGQCNQ